MRVSRYARVAAVCAALSVAALVVAGCSDDDGDGGDSGGDKQANIAYLSYALTDFVQAEVQGVNQALTEAGGGSVKVFNANFDPAKLIKDCQDAVASGRYNAFIIAPVDHVSAVPCVKAAEAANIPVGTIEGTIGTDEAKTYDIQPQMPGVVAVNIIPIQSMIDIQAENLKQACADKDPCEVIGEIANPSDPLTTDALAGVLKAVPNAKLVAKFDSNYDPAAVSKAMPDLLAANPGVDVYYSIADSSALAALPALEDAGLTGKVALIGNGGSRAGVKALADGTMFASIATWPQQAGKQVASALIQAVNGEEITDCCVDQLKMDTPAALNKETVGDFTPEWGAE